MDERPDESRAAIGLTIKSGWAAAVLLDGHPRSPRVVDSRRIELSDPSVPESRQPYHAAFGTARAEGPDLSRLLDLVRQFASASIAEAIRQYRSAGHHVTGAGLVVGSLVDPERLANAHVRIHALEGQLFRRVVEDAAAAAGLECAVWRERDLYPAAAGELNESEDHLRNKVKTLGRAVPGMWRAEQKAATVAAWLVLTSAVAR